MSTWNTYNEVPWIRKTRFVVASLLMFAPALLPVVLTGDVYYERNGEPRRYPTVARVLLIGWTALMTFAVVRFLYTTMADTPSGRETAQVVHATQAPTGERASMSEGEASKKPALTVGDTFRIDAFEIAVNSAETRTTVGESFTSSEAAEGGVYIAVRWSYKNISAKPISAFSVPNIHLVAPDGTRYDADVGASGSFAGEVDSNAKMVSDLNPGIRVHDADVFEVSKQMFDPNTWRILIEIAGQEIPVRFRLLRDSDQQPMKATVADGTEADTPSSGADGTSPTIAPAPQPTSAAPVETPSPVATGQHTITDAGNPVASEQPVSPSFDCNRAATNVERMICANPQLANADADLAAFYKKSLVVAGDSAKGIREEQRAFLQKRNRCDSVGCVAEAYRARREELAQLGYVRE